MIVGETRRLLQCRRCQALFFAHCSPHSEKSAISLSWKGFAIPTIRLAANQVQAGHLDPPYPAHHFLHGGGRYGLQCLCNLDQLPPTGAVIVAAPLKIQNGSGSPLRVLALVPGKN